MPGMVTSSRMARGCSCRASRSPVGPSEAVQGAYPSRSRKPTHQITLRLVVVNDQHDLVARRVHHLRVGCGTVLGGLLLYGCWKNDDERAALAFDGPDGDIAAEQRGKRLGERKTKPSAAELTRGRGVGLLEALEQFGELLFRHADAGCPSPRT